MQTVGGGFGFSAQRTPGTMGLVIALVASYLLAWIGLRELMVQWLPVVPAEILTRPWGLLTYPLASLGNGTDAFFFLFLLLWLFNVGNAIEAELGTQRFLLTVAALSLVGGVAWTLGGLALAPGAALFGPGLPVAALSVLWGARYRTAVVRLMFILPITGLWLAVLTAVLTVLGYGAGNPPMGLVALVPLAVAWLYGDGRLPIAYGRPSTVGVSKKERERKERDFSQFIDQVKAREKEREERERLRRLFESSLRDEDDPKKP